MSGPHVEEPTPLPARLVAYYRDMLQSRANDPILGVCPVCRVSRCQDWRSASERIVSAGEAVKGHERWADLVQSTDGGR